MATALFEYLSSILFSYMGLAGSLSTIVWMVSYAPKFPGRASMSAHPYIWKYGPLSVALVMFAMASFDAYWQKYKELEATRLQLADSNNAQGLLALASRTEHLAKVDYVFIDFENTSPSKALEMSVESIEVSVGDQFRKQHVVDGSAPIAPSRTTSIPFTFIPFGNEVFGQKINFSIRGNYGFAGSSTTFRMCEAMVCDLDIGAGEGEMRSLACHQNKCR